MFVSITKADKVNPLVILRNMSFVVIDKMIKMYLKQYTNKVHANTVVIYVVQ